MALNMSLYGFFHVLQEGTHTFASLVDHRNTVCEKFAISSLRTHSKKHTHKHTCTLDSTFQPFHTNMSTLYVRPWSPHDFVRHVSSVTSEYWKI